MNRFLVQRVLVNVRNFSTQAMTASSVQSIMQFSRADTKRNILVTTPDSTIGMCADSLTGFNVSALLVIQRKENHPSDAGFRIHSLQHSDILGVISERDIVRNFHSDSTKTVGDMMSKNLIFVTSEDPLEKAMGLMLENNIRHLPVIDMGKSVVAVVSMKDVMHTLQYGSNPEEGAKAMKARSVYATQKRRQMYENKQKKKSHPLTNDASYPW